MRTKVTLKIKFYTDASVEEVLKTIRDTEEGTKDGLTSVLFHWLSAECGKKSRLISEEVSECLEFPSEL